MVARRQLRLPLKGNGDRAGCRKPGASPGSLGHSDLATVEGLRAALDRAGFTGAGVQAALGLRDDSSLFQMNVPLYLRRLGQGDALSTLIKLFVLGSPVGNAEAKDALAPLDLARAQESGLLECFDDGVRPAVKLVPCEGLVFASDLRIGDPLNVPPDYVTGVNPTSRTLSNVTVRRAVTSSLDLGTGCGVQALLAAQHSQHVVAVDINQRALDFAAFNARLNGISNIEFRLGNLFEPVEGQRFDLIVCNPPYVISPDSMYTYRDGGLPGDEFCRQLVRQAPRFLEDGGYAHVLCNWTHRREQQWSDPLGQWVQDNGCGTLLLYYGSEDPLTYADRWNQPLRSADPGAYEQTLDRWADYYQRSGIEAIAFGAVVLRRSSGRGWVQMVPLPSNAQSPAGDQLQNMFAAQDYLAGLESAQDLLAGTFRLVERHHVEQRLAQRDGQYAIQGSAVCLDEGLGLRGVVDPYAFFLMARCDGTRPLGLILDDLAKVSGEDKTQLVESTLAVVRTMLGLGFLIPARPLS